MLQICDEQEFCATNIVAKAFKMVASFNLLKPYSGNYEMMENLDDGLQGVEAFKNIGRQRLPPANKNLVV